MQRVQYLLAKPAWIGAIEGFVLPWPDGVAGVYPPGGTESGGAGASAKLSYASARSASRTS